MVTLGTTIVLVGVAINQGTQFVLCLGMLIIFQ